MINKIIKIAKEAGEILMKYHSQDIEVKTKSDSLDFVSTADVESDKFIRKRLGKEFPNDLILSEENEDRPVDFSGKVWMVDPLDGTKNFLNKGDGFAIMIGLCKDGIPILGVVYAPAKRWLTFAEKGKGAFFERDGQKGKLSVSDISNFEDSTIAVRIKHGESRPLDAMLEKLNVKTEIPAVSLKLAIVSEGNAEFSINTNFRASKWDTCATQIILEEAGGKVTNFDGEPLDYKQKSLKWARSYVGSNSIIHKKIIEFIKENE